MKSVRIVFLILTAILLVLVTTSVKDKQVVYILMFLLSFLCLLISLLLELIELIVKHIKSKNKN
jgi:hypothetical protein